MSKNATRYSSMHNVRNGMMAYMGIAAQQAALTVEQPYTPTIRSYASITDDLGARIDYYHTPKPVVVKTKRLGHKMSVTSFVYLLVK